LITLAISGQSTPKPNAVVAISSRNVVFDFQNSFNTISRISSDVNTSTKQTPNIVKFFPRNLFIVAKKWHSAAKTYKKLQLLA